MAQEQRPDCPDCDLEFSRRAFLATTGAALAATSLGARALAAPSAKSDAEQHVKSLFETLTAEQKKEIVLPWSDNRRTKINANWHITNARVKSLTTDQQMIVKDIVKGITSEDGYERFLRQMSEDGQGLPNYAIAIFGDPNSDQCEFELTGRHLTLRADGNTTPGAAFGGPIVYGHGKTGNAEANLFWYQTKSANEVFKALDGKQRKEALQARAPKESAVELRSADAISGISGASLSADQRELVAKALADVLKPYRKEDVDEAMECVKAAGGIEGLNMAFYQTGDLDDDGVWDVWRIEGPSLVCHFRGAPHVHAYINVATRG